jgi:DNA-binding LacI/PurR family transcriptional regulator
MPTPPRSKNATIKDVAREAGVAISTVSSVVNGNKRVSDELAERVRTAIKKLDFYPNQLARSLNAKQTRTLAFVTPDITNVGFLRIFKAIDEIARERGYALFLINTDGSIPRAQEALKQIIELRMDGVFVTLSWALAHPEVNVRQLVERGISLVGVSGSYAIPEIDCFLWDEEGAGEQLGSYLRRLGHSSVLCVGPSGSRASEKRWGGVRRAFADDAGATITVASTEAYTARAGYDALQGAIVGADRFTAIIAFNDAIATGALAALYDHGMSVPGDVSFVSFGDHHRDFSRPQITSMTFDENRIAALAANRLIDRVESAIAPQPRHEYLPLQLAIQPSSQKQVPRRGSRDHSGKGGSSK